MGRSPPSYRFPTFHPHRLLRGGHAQTIAGVYVPHRRIRYSARQVEISLPDGDRTLLHDDRPAEWKPGDRCVLLLHGLGGSHLSPHMVRIASKLNARGVRAFRLDLRGHGAAWQLARHPGHAGRSEDALAAVRQIARECPGSPLSMVGVSMGGNIVLKLLGELGDEAVDMIRQALVIAPPIDLAACSLNLLARANRVYARVFLRELQAQVKLRGSILKGSESLKIPRPPRNLWEFDDLVTAPLSGFAGAVDYYQQCSAIHRVSSIRVPTTVLSAADDPLIPSKIFDAAKWSASTHFHLTPFGGHVGFLGEAGRDPDRRWLDWRVVDWESHET
ncbi:MAG TPA: alpha/beta fold hydrolase [Pirellulaceae bacterium]|nr:alpha/beta fold hydrolase [Pirellulaceae bacterium]